MEEKRFTKNDEGFICAYCGKEVQPLGYTSRNHCPYCLHSLHLDINPGDRACNCGGIMSPIGIEISPKKGYVIIHKCDKCNLVRKNKSANDDDKEVIFKVCQSTLAQPNAGPKY